jgi:hypothetical protein
MIRTGRIFTVLFVMFLMVSTTCCHPPLINIEGRYYVVNGSKEYINRSDMRVILVVSDKHIELLYLTLSTGKVSQQWKREYQVKDDEISLRQVESSGFSDPVGPLYIKTNGDLEMGLLRFGRS